MYKIICSIFAKFTKMLLMEIIDDEVLAYNDELYTFTAQNIRIPHASTGKP